MRLLTASRAGLAFKCSYFLRPEVPHDTSPMGAAAEEGTLLHSIIEADLLGKTSLPLGTTVGNLDAASLARVEAKFAAWKEWARSEKRIGWRPEVPLAYHAKSDSARELPPGGHRDYSEVMPGEVAMQVDVVSFGEDASGTYAEVIDWKSGQKSDSAAAQVGLAALALSRAFDVERVRARVVYIGEDGVTVDEAWLSGFDLDMVRGNVLRVVEKADPEPRPGPHCSSLYCPARHACPATVAALAEVADVPTADIQKLVAGAIKTPADAGAAHVRLRVIKDAVKAVEERIRAVVEKEGSAPTPGGKVLRLVTTTRETFSRSRLPKEQADRILAELRDVGALAESTSSYIKECSK